MIGKLKDIVNKRTIIILTLMVCCLHLFASVFRFFYPYTFYLFTFFEQLTLDALGIIVGLLLIQEDVEHRKLYLKAYFSKEQILLTGIYIALILSSFFNALLNNMDIWAGNAGYRFDMFVCVFIIFPVGRFYNSKEKVYKVVRRIVELFLFFLAAVMGFILINTFQGKVLHTIVEGNIGMAVFNNTLQFSVNCHPNTVGAYSGLLFLLCFYFVWKSKGVKKVLYITESIIHYVVLALSNSRGAYFSMLCVAACMTAVIVYYVLPHKNTYLKWMKTFLAGILIFGLLIILRDTVFSLYAMITPPKTIVLNDSGKTIQQDEVIRQLNIGFVNNRHKIWKCTLHLIAEKPLYMLLGVTPYQVSVMLGDRLEWEIDVYTHNQILEVAADIGIPAMVLFLVFSFLVAEKCLKMGFESVVETDQWKRKLLLLILLFLALANVMEATLLFYDFLSGSVFILLCGWVCKQFQMGQQRSDENTSN